jgi:hypothetical protein
MPVFLKQMKNFRLKLSRRLKIGILKKEVKRKGFLFLPSSGMLLYKSVHYPHLFEKGKKPERA